MKAVDSSKMQLSHRSMVNEAVRYFCPWATSVRRKTYIS